MTRLAGRCSSVVVFGLCVLLCVRGSARADGGDVESRARTHYAAGKALYDLGHYSDALRELLAGYSLVPKRQFLLNLGQCYRRIGDLRSAREMYVKYRNGSPADDPERLQVDALIREIDRQIVAAVPSPTTTSAPAPLIAAAPVQTERAQPKPPRRRWWAIPVAAVAAAGLAVGLYFALAPTCSGSLTCISAHRE